MNFKDIILNARLNEKFEIDTLFFNKFLIQKAENINTPEPEYYWILEDGKEKKFFCFMLNDKIESWKNEKEAKLHLIQYLEKLEKFREVLSDDESTES
jgi:hypothetical protein